MYDVGLNSPAISLQPLTVGNVGQVFLGCGRSHVTLVVEVRIAEGDTQNMMIQNRTENMNMSVCMITSLNHQLICERSNEPNVFHVDRNKSSDDE